MSSQRNDTRPAERDASPAEFSQTQIEGIEELDVPAADAAKVKGGRTRRLTEPCEGGE